MSFNFGNIPLLENDIISKGGERIPVCLCLDVSASMSGARINKLNAGIKDFKNMVCEDLRAKMATDLCIVTFSSTVQCEMVFTPLAIAEMPTLQASGNTHLGEGVDFALNMLEARKAYYKQEGIQYNQPIIFIMSDGDGNGSKTIFNQVVEKVRYLTENRKLSAFGIAIDSRSNIDELTQITNNQALMLDNTKFNEFFVWLSQSVTAVANSGKDVEHVPLPSIEGWATLAK